MTCRIKTAKLDIAFKPISVLANASSSWVCPLQAKKMLTEFTPHTPFASLSSPAPHAWPGYQEERVCKLIYPWKSLRASGMCPGGRRAGSQQTAVLSNPST